jgi:hypothetical protein
MQLPTSLIFTRSIIGSRTSFGKPYGFIVNDEKLVGRPAV